MVCEIFTASKGSPFKWILPLQEAAGMLHQSGFLKVLFVLSVFWLPFQVFLE